MVISNVVGQQFAFLLPVGLVIVCAVLVFAFGFKANVEPPNFKHLSLVSDDRKSLKRKKPKEKRAQVNGHATVIIDESEGKTKPLKQSNKPDSKSKEAKKENPKSPSKSEKKVEKRSGKENQETPKQKKNEKRVEEKPSDFDEGEWETAFSRKDKKNRKKEDDVTVSTPEKSKKKTPKEDKSSSPKKSNQDDKTPVPSPGGKRSGEKKEAKGSPEKKIRAEVIVKEEKTPEPKPQRFEKPAESPKVEKTIVAHLESAPVSNEVDDDWKEAAQKKAKKKVRKD